MIQSSRFVRRPREIPASRWTSDCSPLLLYNLSRKSCYLLVRKLVSNTRGCDNISRNNRQFFFVTVFTCIFSRNNVKVTFGRQISLKNLHVHLWIIVRNIIMSDVLFSSFLMQRNNTRFLLFLSDIKNPEKNRRSVKSLDKRKEAICRFRSG